MRTIRHYDCGQVRADRLALQYACRDDESKEQELRGSRFSYSGVVSLKSIRNAAEAFQIKKKKRRIYIYSYSATEKSNREEEFDALTKQWIRETRFHSSLSKKFMHPAYQTIMAMGTDALPLIFRELQKAPGHWFYALRFIVRKDVAESAQSFEEARTLWLNWAKKHKYIQ